VFARGYHEADAGGLGARDHPWRKPNLGMLLAAAQRLGLHLAKSWIVGDRSADLVAGRAAGLAGGTVNVSGDPPHVAPSVKAPGFRVRVAADLREAVGTADTIRRLLAC